MAVYNLLTFRVKSVGVEMQMSYGDEPEYITWQLFEGEENLGGMKTRMNGIPQSQAPCPLMTQVWEIK